MIAFIRRHLGLKIFLSYLFVILAAGIVLAVTLRFSLPTSFNRHMMDMRHTMMGGSPGMMDPDLFVNFQAGASEALGVAGYRFGDCPAGQCLYHPHGGCPSSRHDAGQPADCRRTV